MRETDKRTRAWIGDAVLALYARQWILNQPDIAAKERASVFIQMTSNQFLASLGEPTSMEAEIGTIYQDSDLEEAFRHIERKFLPVFLKQRLKSKQPGSYRTQHRAQ